MDDSQKSEGKMKLKETVCSVELAIELKKLRVPQKSLFYWNRYPTDEGFNDSLNDFHIDPIRDSRHEFYSAFTVAELGEMICAGAIIEARTKQPKYGEIFQQDKCPKWDDGDKMWALYLAGDEIYTFDDNEANARARFLICLLHRKLVKTKELKKK
jgi:hypothetical protein